MKPFTIVCRKTSKTALSRRFMDHFQMRFYKKIIRITKNGFGGVLEKHIYQENPRGFDEIMLSAL
jgi:hypothetical protein